ncbi:MAG: hypothetical protein KGS45_06550 [Planctomycetes bacterium]|nr:hypothetical protein [Planctomycetota bacterium]
MFISSWRVVFFILATLMTSLTSIARAADPPIARLTSVQFGFDGRMQPERWAPLRITIDAVQRPFSGLLIISYPQDQTQNAVLRVAAAGTPGVATPIDTAICLKRHPATIGITLLDERGNLVDRLRFGSTSQFPDAPPFTFDEREGLVVCIGRVSPHRHIEPLELAPDSQDQSDYYRQVQEPSNARMGEIRAMRLGSLHTAEADPFALPTNWAAYDTAEAIVLRTEELSDRISTASRQAILQWVQSGGRLVLVVDQPGDLWRTWLPDGMASFITLADPQRVPVPSVWQDVMSNPDRSAFTFVTRANKAAQTTSNTPNTPSLTPPAPTSESETPASDPTPVPDTPVETSADPEPTSNLGGPSSMTERLKVYNSTFTPADSILARPITLAPQLKNSGWTTATRIDTSIVRPPGPAHSSGTSKESSGPALIAHGPVGLGYVTILTADPTLAAATPSPEPARRVWLSALEPALADYLSLPLIPANARHQWWGGWTGGTSGSNDFQSRAITKELNALADHPGKNLDPLAVLIALLVCALLLALLLGPIDGLVLHAKRKLHFSWATALFWIVVVSLIAGFVPYFLRGNLPTMRITHAVDDVVIDFGGSAGWRTTLYGLFASHPGSRPLIAPPDEPTSGAAFRGVAVGEYWNTSTPIFTPIDLVQSSTLSPRGSETSLWPLPLSQGQWSFRNALSVGPISIVEDRMPIRARAIRIDEHSIRVEVEGTPLAPPSVCTLTSGELRHSNLTALSDLAVPDRPGELSFREIKPVADRIPAYSDSSSSAATELRRFDPTRSKAEGRVYGTEIDLPGIQRHDLAIESRLATGRWALITLTCKIEIPSVPGGERAREMHTRTYRLLVPIEGSATPLTDSGATP